MLSRIRIILSHTTHPGNIGACARAMKTMGLSQLILINPQDFPSQRATAMASGADDILANAQVVSDLSQALHGSFLVIGASARSRSLKWPLINPEQCAQQILSLLPTQSGDIALLLGTEHSGLTNLELQHCQRHVNIPANPAYCSLNLAQAVQILAYEIRKAWLAKPLPMAARTQPLANAQQLEGFYLALQQLLVDIQFLKPQQPRTLMARLRRLFYRAELDQQEINILRGMIRHLQQRLGRNV